MEIIRRILLGKSRELDRLGHVPRKASAGLGIWAPGTLMPLTTCDTLIGE